MVKTEEAKVNVQDLWARYKGSRSITDRNRLVEHYRPLVHMLTARLVQKLPPEISYDEICSAGWDGLIEAVQDYNPQNADGFEPFARRKVVRSATFWLRASDGLENLGEINSETVRVDVPSNKMLEDYVKRNFNRDEQMVLRGIYQRRESEEEISFQVMVSPSSVRSIHLRCVGVLGRRFEDEGGKIDLATGLSQISYNVQKTNNCNFSDR